MTRFNALNRSTTAPTPTGTMGYAGGNGAAGTKGAKANAGASAPTGSLFVTMGPGRPGQGDRRHSQPAGPFSHLIGSVEYFSPGRTAADRRDETRMNDMICMAGCAVS